MLFILQDYSSLDNEAKAQFRDKFDKAVTKGGNKDLSWTASFMDQYQTVKSSTVGRIEDFYYMCPWGKLMQCGVCVVHFILLGRNKIEFGFATGIRSWASSM